MADLAVGGGLEKILELALSINRAVQTVRRNKEECYRIERRVSRISDILSKLQQEATEVVNGPAVSGVLKDLSETLGRALTLVTDCQERESWPVLVLLCTAGDMAMQLREVREDMSEMMVTALFAINASGVCRPSSTEGEASHVVTVSRPVGDSDRAEAVNDEDHWFECEEVSFAACLSLVGMSYPRPSNWRQEWGILSCTKFSLSELEVATHNFSEENLIRQGPFVAVYKGVLHDEAVVIIQKIDHHYNFHEKEIRDKIRFVLELNHKNIVQFLGYGYTEQMLVEVDGDSNVDKDYVFLVEEFMANGRLDNIIHGSHYDWSSRFQLIQGIAHGLHYLHKQQIVHLDLTPKNILVDYEMNPKITDFGRARMLHQDDEVVTTSVTCILPGTMGYMPPEYIMEGTVSKMYDVYSFGVILLEILSGMCRSEPPSHQSSIEWAWIAREGARMEELLDLKLCSESQQKEARRCLEVGLLCTQSDQADRPTMLDVVEMLEYKKELATPEKPKYIKIPRNGKSIAHN